MKSELLNRTTTNPKLQTDDPKLLFYLCCMSEHPKPIRRSEQLLALSKEHHDGLLFAWKIRQGIKNGTDVKDIGAFVQWFWKADLQDHFRQEEEAFVQDLIRNTDLVKRMHKEHQHIKTLIQTTASTESLTQLADAIHDHIRFEERILFPFIETTLPADQLNRIQEQLSKEKGQCPKWENEFWLKK